MPSSPSHGHTVVDASFAAARCRGGIARRWSRPDNCQDQPTNNASRWRGRGRATAGGAVPCRARSSAGRRTIEPDDQNTVPFRQADRRLLTSGATRCCLPPCSTAFARSRCSTHELPEVFFPVFETVERPSGVRRYGRRTQAAHRRRRDRCGLIPANGRTTKLVADVPTAANTVAGSGPEQRHHPRDATTMQQ